MNKEQNVTTKFKIDVSEFKKGISEANKNIKLANAEFKAASAGLDKVDDSSKILSLTIDKLKKNLTEEEKKLSILKTQEEETIKKQNENVNSLKKLQEAYQKASASKNVDAEELRKLKRELEQAILAQAQTSKSADDLRIKILNQTATVNKLSKEINDTEKDYESLESELNSTVSSFDKSSESIKNSTEGFTIAKGAIASLIADGLKKLASESLETAKSVVKFGDDFDNSFRKLTAQTGMLDNSTLELEDLKEVLKDIYKNNYGESIEDVANAIGIVSRNVKNLTTQELKELTQDAIALRDTFDFDLNETMRTAKMLMDQYGISGKEAFNLIAQGAQKGLDKNGDLLDTINEYAVHYKQLGYSSEEFFNSLINGAENGTFSVDKLGDAVKEFGIRTKDTAKTTTEGFELLGFNADEMRKSFNAGGEEAKRATEKTITALMSMDDKVKQNQAGVDLFGTMWEDLGIKGIQAIMNMNGNIDKTYKSMQKIEDISYLGVQNTLKETGRAIQTDLLIPLSNKLIPVINKYVKEYSPKVKQSLEWGIKNLPKIGKSVAVVGGTIVTYNATVKATTTLIKATTIAQTTYHMIVQKLTNATKAQTIAQTALNTAQKASVAGLVVTATVALSVATINLVKNMDSQSKKQKELIKNLQDEKKQIDELEESKNKQISAGLAELNHLESLKNELGSLIDANGNLKEGYESRAKFILNELNQALGTEINLNDVLKGKYDEVSGSIDNLIDKQKANIILQASEEQYQEALKNQIKTLSETTKYKEELEIANEKLHFSQIKLDSAILSGNQKQIDALGKEVQENIKTKNQKKELYDESIQNLRTYQEQIASYEELASAVTSGNTEKIKEAIEARNTSYQNGKETVKLSLDEQIANQVLYSSSYKKLLDDDVKNGIEAENSKYNAQLNGSNQRLLQLAQELVSQTSTVNENSPVIIEAWKNLSNGSVDTFNSVVSTLPEDLQKTIASMGIKVINSKGEVVRSFDEMGKESVDSVNKYNASFQDATGKMAKDGAKSVEDKKIDMENATNNFMDGADKGIKKKSPGLLSQITAWADDMIKSIQKAWDVHSPSKKTENVTDNFMGGILKSIKNNKGKTVNQVRLLANDMLSEYDKISFDKLKIGGIETFDNFSKIKTGLATSMQNISQEEKYYSTTNSSNVKNEYIFNQYNNSTNTNDHLTQYRQTKNLLAMMAMQNNLKRGGKRV